MKTRIDGHFTQSLSINMLSIIKDTREKAGWDFGQMDCMVERKALSAGDYTLADFPNLIIIERKASCLELANNLGRWYDRFCRECEKFAQYKYKYLIFEFSFDDLINFPTNLPDKLVYKTNAKGKKVRKIRMSGPFMAARLNKLVEKYDIEIVFAQSGLEAENTAYMKMLDAINETHSE